MDVKMYNCSAAVGNGRMRDAYHQAIAAIMDPFNNVKACLKKCKMSPSIANATNCKIRDVICFLNKSVVIHGQICEVYGENFMIGW